MNSVGLIGVMKLTKYLTYLMFAGILYMSVLSASGVNYVDIDVAGNDG